MLNRRSVVVCSVVLSLAGPACGENATPAGPSAPKAGKQDLPGRLRLASVKTMDAKSARFSLSVSTPEAGGSLSGEGLQDFENKKMSMTMDLSGLLPSSGSAPPKFEQRLIGQTMYMKGELFQHDLPPGKSWVKLDLEKLGEQSGLNLGELLKQARTSDPSVPVNFLPGAKGDIQILGTEKIRGADTTHYKFTVDIEQAAKELSSQVAGNVKPLFQQLGVKEFPAEAWIDNESRVRKMTYSLNLSRSSPDGQAPLGPVSTSMEFFDFGVKADVTEPPAAEVVDFQGLSQPV